MTLPGQGTSFITDRRASRTLRVAARRGREWKIGAGTMIRGDQGFRVFGSLL